MAMDRLYLKNMIKSALGMARDVEDGLLTDGLIHEAIDESMKTLADDCDLIDARADFALRSGQWKYPYDDRVLSIRRIWWKEDDQRNNLVYLESEPFMDGYDPTDLDSRPYFYSYPHFQGPVFKFYGQAAPNQPYIGVSRVTKATARTLVDSGASLGRTESGNKIIPLSIVQNTGDGSYGYVQKLDIETPAATGTAGASTSSTMLVDGGEDFIALGVEEGWLITDGADTGIVTKWAFVTEIGTTSVLYEDYEGGYFEPGDLYRIGPCDKIWLSIAAPYRGLRHGVQNKFDVVAATATIAGTTFTATRCSGTITGTATVGQEAIASGGAHGKIEVVESAYVDVEYWIGGQPADGETVSVQACDEYTIQSRFRTERVLWIKPTPNANDTLGDESLHVLFNDTPQLPTRDTDPIEIPEHYNDPLLACCLWQSILRKGSHSMAEVTAMQTIYREQVRPYLADANKPPRNEPLRPIEAQDRAALSYGRTDVGPSGAAWDWRG